MSDEKEGPLSSDDSFLREEKVIEEEEERERRRCSPQSPPFDVEDYSWDNNRDSFVTALENPADLSSPPPGGDDGNGNGTGAGCGAGVMSTIEEESRSYEETTTSAGASISISKRDQQVHEEGQEEVESEEVNKNEKDLDESQELREIQKLVEETTAELNDNNKKVESATFIASPRFRVNLPEVESPGAEDAVHHHHQQQYGHGGSQPTEDDLEGFEALLRKLEKLESCQNILEDVLNTGDPENINLDEFIAQIPMHLPNAIVRRNCGEEDQDQSPQRSVSSEIASIQKIIDGADLSSSFGSEVAGGNQNLLSSETNPKENISGERSVADVLKEYEDLERSMSCASVIEESFRSDISSVPPVSTSTRPLQAQAAGKTAPAPVPVPPVTYSNPVTSTPPFHIAPVPAPVIKPPVLKTVVSPSAEDYSTNPSKMPVESSTKDYYYYSNTNKTSQNHPQTPQCPHGQDSTGNSSRTRPMTSNPTIKNTTVGSKSSRIEYSQSAQELKLQQNVSHSARAAFSATTTSNKDTPPKQDALKPRNRRMRSPRTVVSPRNTQDAFKAGDIPTGTSAKGGGEGSQSQVSKKEKGNSHQHQQLKSNRSVEKVEAVVAAEALKTIEKLNTMVARQETLLGAYSKDNERLWEQLRVAKNESQEKEVEFQDVINSLKTEVATLKLNRLVTPAAQNPANCANKAELVRLREDSELKSHQLLELRKELLHLQSKLASRQARSPSKSKQSATSHVSEEKEKEYQKTINGLSKQVRTLQRILYSKEESAPPPPPTASEGNNTKSLQRTKSDVTRRSNANNNTNVSNAKQVQQQRTNLRNAGMATAQVFGKRTSGKPVNINTGEILQASFNCLDQERDEFENIIAEKNKIIFEKEKMILNLREQVEALKNRSPDGDAVEPGLIDELRSRIIAQNKVIQTLKEHLSTFKKMETENMLLREEKSSFEQQARDLRRRLEFAQSLVKPENEVLCLLSEKVDELNSRYYQRERQLDTLLNRLSVKTTTGGGGALSSSSSNDSGDRALCLHSTNLSPRRRLPLGQFSSNNGSLGGALLASSVGGKGRSSTLISADILHMVDLSPTNSFQLFDTDDLPEA